MHLTFLGTGADSSYPLAFCACPTCTQARRIGGKNLRRRSSALVNDDLLIDLGPDAVQAALAFGANLASLKVVLVTHAHSDHMDVTHLVTRIPEYGGLIPEVLRIVASRGTIKRMNEMLRAVGFEHPLDSPQGQAALTVQVSPIAHGESLVLGEYRLTAFESNHDASVESLIYVIEHGGRTLLYDTDTNTLPERTWAAMQGFTFDVVILDHTYGPGADGGGHLNAERFQAHLHRFKADGLLSDGARVFATHLSHEGNGEHEQLSAYATRHGYEVAWDGLKLDI